MKKLMFLFMTLDEKAFKAFTRILQHQQVLRRQVTELLELLEQPLDERDQEHNAKLIELTRYFPDPVRMRKVLAEFSQHLSNDPHLMTLMKIIVTSDTSCQVAANSLVSLFTPLYYTFSVTDINW